MKEFKESKNMLMPYNTAVHTAFILSNILERNNELAFLEDFEVVIIDLFIKITEEKHEKNCDRNRYHKYRKSKD